MRRQIGLRTIFAVTSGIAVAAAAAGGAFGVLVQVLVWSLLLVFFTPISLALLVGWPILVIWACESIARFWARKSPESVELLPADRSHLTDPADPADRTDPSDQGIFLPWP